MAAALHLDRRHRRRFDGVIVVGAGLAGLSAALAAAPRKALVLSPKRLGEGCASSWAQGGMAAALAADDCADLHAADTLAAGAGLCDPGAVEILTREAPQAIARLAALGAPFDRTAAGAFVQGLEAAHSRPRIARVGGDGAGAAIMGAMFAAARAAAHIEIQEGVEVLRLLVDTAGRVRGVLARKGDELAEILSPATLLATGGLGGLYAVTTDPVRVQGDGLALAALAGAAIRDAEFVQFHPTAIDLGGDPAPLASEALRGEGAQLIDRFGERFMPRYHPAAELAPRDVVARAIASERLAGRGAFLDARPPLIADVADEFPAAFAACRERGLDPRDTPIPVLPAAHYHMGGVETDLHGAATLSGLFAAGEAAAVGVHGANRLASNSLLEAAVFGRRAGLAAREATAVEGFCASPTAPPALPREALAVLRSQMSAQAGVVRDADGLASLLGWVRRTQEQVGPALPLITAGVVAQAALDRRESRGGHFRRDYPKTASEALHSRQLLAGDVRDLAAA